MEKEELYKKLQDLNAYEALSRLLDRLSTRYCRSNNPYKFENILNDALRIIIQNGEDIKSYSRTTHSLAYILAESGVAECNNKVLKDKLFLSTRESYTDELQSKIDTWVICLKNKLKDSTLGVSTTKSEQEEASLSALHDFLKSSSALEKAITNLNHLISEKDSKIANLEQKVEELEEKLKNRESIIRLERRNNTTADITEAFSIIANRYMKSNDNKSQTQREHVRNTLNDIMCHLKLSPSEDIKKRINEFDNLREPKGANINNNFNGNITNYGTMTGDCRNN